jgi:hypothetical protein
MSKDEIRELLLETITTLPVKDVWFLPVGWSEIWVGQTDPYPQYHYTDTTLVREGL